ncbi:hypothetical protein [Lacticaseibacillus absianus]|uniref:hypothetical protein n=1 Tax=Lacticaseibacillus absianus TaxID=2729623 RepID=UPI0015CBADF4|nr:hypothetical protein [Lacticaseibacillus absianus]
MCESTHVSTPLDPKLADQVKVGVEIERLRVDPSDRLSDKPFPTRLAAWLQPFVSREYFNAQIEFALPPQADAAANVAQINTVIAATAAALAPDERLWTYSCPPPLPRDLSADLISVEPRTSYPYRQALRQRYDLRRLMNSGVHLNISFGEPALAALQARTGLRSPDALYLHVAQQFMVSRWLLIYLFGATPISFAGYLKDPMIALPVRSLRNSALGFPTSIRGNYHSLAGYVTRIETAVAAGTLLQPGQYYESVRLKSETGKAPKRLLTDGISHLELRTFDLNPMTIGGVTVDQLRLIQLLAVYLAARPPLTEAAFDQALEVSRQLSEAVACEDPRGPSVCQAQGLALVDDWAAWSRCNSFAAADQARIARVRSALTDNRQTLAYQVFARCQASHAGQ